MPKNSLVHTHIPGLDELFGGGIPPRTALVITGSPGSGKTILAGHIAFEQAKRGKKVVIATMTSEPHIKLLDALRQFDFLDETQIGNTVQMISAYAYLKRGAKELKQTLVAAVRDFGAEFLIIDGIRAIRDLWHEDAAVRDFFYELGVGLATANCLGLYTAEYTHDLIVTLAEGTTVDGILALWTRDQGPHRMRRVEVVKLRGQRHLRGEHSMRIDRQGVTFTPRLENQQREDRGLAADKRLGFGIPELDRLLGGGIPEASATIIAGTSGIGKTLLSLQFLAEGARKNERCMLVSFDEQGPSIVRRAKQIGLDLAPLCDSGNLILRHISPVEMDADEVAFAIRREIASSGITRVAIDSLGDLIYAVPDPQRLRNFVFSLVEMMRGLHVTTLFTREIPKVTGPELDFSDTPAATAAENLLYLRHQDDGQKLCRLLTILKMRSSQHDPQTHTLSISDAGITVVANKTG